MSIEQWLEAPQVVLDGKELLIFCVLLVIGGFVFLMASIEKKE